MLDDVWPGLNFWYYLAIISSPSWLFSFLAMDFMKKTTGLPSFFLISTLVLSWSAANFVLSKSYFWLRRNPQTDRFFRGCKGAGKTIGFAVLFFGNAGLNYFSEKSAACLLTFLSLALYCLCTLFCIQPYTDFGALEFLLGASLNQTLSFFGIRSSYTWLVIIVCIVIAWIRYRLEPVHSPGEATSLEDLLESGILPSMTYEAESPLLLVARLDDNPSPSDNFLELAPGGSTSPLMQADFIGQLLHMTHNQDPVPKRAQLLEANPEILSPHEVVRRYATKLIHISEGDPIESHTSQGYRIEFHTSKGDRIEFYTSEGDPVEVYTSEGDLIEFEYVRNLQNPRSLKIYDRHSLNGVFAPTMVRCFSQLRELTIRGCEMLSRIVAEENGMGESTVDEVIFPLLERLVLLDLPNLGNILVLQDLPNLVSKMFPNVKSLFPDVNTALPKLKIH